MGRDATVTMADSCIDRSELGNFAFGAMSAKLAIPLWIALEGAKWAHTRDDLGTFDAADRAAVELGYMWWKSSRAWEVKPFERFLKTATKRVPYLPMPMGLPSHGGYDRELWPDVEQGVQDKGCKACPTERCSVRSSYNSTFPDREILTPDLLDQVGGTEEIPLKLPFGLELKVYSFPIIRLNIPPGPSVHRKDVPAGRGAYVDVIHVDPVYGTCTE